MKILFIYLFLLNTSCYAFKVGSFLNINFGKPSKGIIKINGVRRYKDGTYAQSCNRYKNSIDGHLYQGDIGDGIYTISYSGETVNVYCDMTTDTGGWTLVLKMGDYDQPSSLSTASINTSGLQNINVIGIGTTYSKLSDSMINGIKTVNYRLEKIQSSFNASTATAFFPSSCTFQYQSGYSIYNSNNCSTSKPNYSDTSYDPRSTWLNQSNIFGYMSSGANLVRVNGYIQHENHNWVHLRLWVK